MATKEWNDGHCLVTFWLTPEEKAAWLAACKAEGKSQTGVLRDTVLIMLGRKTDGK